MIEVKVCGLRKPGDALGAANAGADMLGFIFAPAPRSVDPEVARGEIESVKLHAGQGAPRFVGVFVNDRPERIRRVASHVGLDLVQLSGDEDPEYAAALGLPVIKAIHIRPGEDLEALRRRASAYVTRIPDVTLLADTLVPGRYGGTGRMGDWKLAAALSRHFPIILAGGLNPENVARAIRAVRPAAVDVSSGVETGDAKDLSKIDAFVRAARVEGGLHDGNG